MQGLLEGDDVLRTAAACRALGAVVERPGDGDWRIRGVGIGGLSPPAGVLDFGNAGTGSRLMMGVVGGHGITATFDGDASLRKRPMRRILDPLDADGRAGALRSAGRALPHRAAAARSIRCRSPIARPWPRRRSSRPILLAGLNAPGVHDRHRERGLARPHREDARLFRRRGAA